MEDFPGVIYAAFTDNDQISEEEFIKMAAPVNAPRPPTAAISRGVRSILKKDPCSSQTVVVRNYLTRGMLASEQELLELRRALISKSGPASLSNQFQQCRTSQTSGHGIQFSERLSKHKSFSKIERDSARSVVRESSRSELLEPMRERLQARLATAGLTLEMDTTSTLKVRVDAAESRPGVGLGLAKRCPFRPPIADRVKSQETEFHRVNPGVGYSRFQ